MEADSAQAEAEAARDDEAVDQPAGEPDDVSHAEPVDETESDPDAETEVTELEAAEETPDPASADAESGDEEADPEAAESLNEDLTTQQVIEGVLFASDTPLTLGKIVSIIGVGTARDARNHIKALNEQYAETGRAFRIENIAGGYQMLTRPEFNTWLRRLKQSRQDSKLSQAAMETLAVVAYKQPVVRAEIEAIRGVASGEMLNRLRELGLVKIVGRAEDLGRPMLYGTTKRFLEVFGLSDLKELPEVEELQSGQ
jgi:segregation and condensation protein B